MSKTSEACEVAVIGTGKLGEFHTKLLKEIAAENKAVHFAGIYDQSPTRAAEISAKYGVPIFKTLDDVALVCDAVSIASPTSFHFQIAEKFLNVGLHCFIEKPITVTVQEAETLCGIAKSKNLKLQVGHIERFNPALLSVEQFITTPMFISSERVANFTTRATDVSVILDLMIHDIDLILSLIHSEVSHISASGLRVISHEIDIANARIEFENGAAATVTASRISRTKARKMRFFCTGENKSYVSLDFTTGKSEVFRIVDKKSKRKTSTLKEFAANKALQLFGDVEAMLGDRTIEYISPDPPKANALKLELESFVHAVTTGGHVKVSGEDGTKALRVAIEITKKIEASKH
jgi:predicted dehydrogenase